MSGLSKLGEALEIYCDLVRSDATDGVILAARVANEELYVFFLSQGASVYEARLWASLLLSRMVL